MIEQEDIPITKEEYFAMVKTISQLRKEKKELIDKVCQWLWDCGYIDTFVIDEVIDNFKKYMEIQQ
jgi:hypothetical protein